MSCEESYLAIRRYLTDGREPYAPGTHGNTKRKIRKAAACYVVREGVLYYQRRQKGQQDFTELEVVLQEGRRKELIDEAHITSGGDHLTQHQTWESISQKYWWRGILKQVKDYIRECSQCQSRQDRGRGSSEDGMQGFGRGRRRAAAADISDVEDIDEDEEMEDLDFGLPKSKNARGVEKHELVFVDSKGVVKQFLPKHGQSMLDKLNQQRLNNQFCDITLLIEGEEYRAHKAVLAACSDYFNELFIEKGAVASHEAVVDLSGFSKASILPLLDFAYTSHLTFNFCVMAEVATLARHLLMSEALEICEVVHRKVEAQKLTVYQRGDTHTVVSSQPIDQPEHVPEQPGTYVVTMQSDGQAVITAAEGEQAGQPLAVIAHPELADAGESLALLAQASQVGAAESLTLLAPMGEGNGADTMTVITHSGHAGSGESLAVVQACWKVDDPQEDATENMETGPVILNVGSTSQVCPELLSTTAPPGDKDSSSFTAVKEPTPAQPQPGQSEPAAEAPPPKRRPGRPRKIKPPPEPTPEPEEEEEAPEPSPMVQEEAQKEEQENSTDDPNRRRLRQRSMGKGSYVRLHMGLEQDEEEENEDGNDKKLIGGSASSPSKAPAKAARRGPRGPQASRKSDSEEAAVAAATVAADIAGEEPESKGVGSTDDPDMMSQSEEGQGDEEPPEKLDGAMETGSASESAVDGEHTCGECGMVFQRRFALIMHSLKHEKGRGFRCVLCHKDFQYAASLRAHMTRHKQKKSQQGSVARPASQEDGLQAGDEGASGDGDGRGKARTKREFVCDICGKTLPKIYSLRIHMLTHTGVRPHTCRVCGKSFAHKHSLKMHRSLHDTVKKFTCTICSKSFVSKRSLEEHTSIHTGESKYLCTTCGRSFFRASGLSKHLKRHQPRPEARAFQCSHCDKSFYEAKDLQQHMNKHLGLKPFQCQECGKCYSWKKDWYSHVKSHTVAEPYKCNVCGKEFYEKALFRRHVKKATHGKKGRVKQNLERECEHCGRKFTQLREYRRHINNHEGVKPFECLTCGVAWADARSLKRHVRTHTGERPYVCPVCQEAHIDARTLRKHMSKLHNDILPGKIMLEKDTLQFHNQGTQVEHAVSILAPELPPELRPAGGADGSGANSIGTEEIETVLITEETVESMEAIQAVADAGAGGQGASVATLSDRSIMQVVNYVLAQQAGTKLDETPEVIQTMEVEVAHVAEVE